MIRKVGSRNYVISVPDGRKKTRLCHVNLLKEYVGRPLAQPVACAVRGSVAVEEDSVPIEAVSVRLENSAALETLETQLQHLPPEWRTATIGLIRDFPSLFSDTPGRTRCAVHDVDVGEAAPVK